MFKIAKLIIFCAFISACAKSSGGHYHHGAHMHKHHSNTHTSHETMKHHGKHSSMTP